MQSIHHRRNLPKTYETTRNRIGDEKREIRKKKLFGELNLHGDLHLSRARRQSQLSLADEDAVSRQRDGSLSLRRKQWSQRKKEKGKGARKLPLSRTPASRIPPAGEPAPSRRRAPSLSPRRDVSLPLSWRRKQWKRKEKKKRERESESAETARRKR